MAKPTLSPSQLAAVTQEKNNQIAQQTALTQSAALQDSEIARKQLVDDSFKQLFNWYDQNIIAKYDAERKAINGIFPINMVTESDLLAVAGNPPSGRLTPTPPATDIIRVAEFDGGTTSSTSTNELQHMTEQLVPENRILVGFGGTSPTVFPTTLTTTPITPSSTTVGITDSAALPVFAVGNRFVIHDGISSVVVEVTSITNTTPDPGGSCSNPTYTTQPTCVTGGGTWTPNAATPPYTFTLGITQIVTGTVNTGASLDATFTTFTNLERTNKLASTSSYQNIMNFHVAQIQIPLNARLARLVEQITAINANEDPYAVATLATAKINAQTSQSFITNYLLTVDISNTGMTSLQNERIARNTQATTRAAAIVSAYTTETENFYNQRYNLANNRASTVKGSLRALSNSQSCKSVQLSLAASLQGSIDALNGII